MIKQRKKLPLKIMHQDLERVIPMHNLLEYSHNYSMASESVRNYYRDKIDDVDINHSASHGKSKIVRETTEIPPQLET